MLFGAGGVLYSVVSRRILSILFYWVLLFSNTDSLVL
jgi:hypothetical protein